ncbi:MAG: tetratricopeptide repeat protein [Chitinophagaceae bacterium]|nr:tetratricopeptide repeat protein [Chitinophagaceae bacterium]
MAKSYPYLQVSVSISKKRHSLMSKDADIQILKDKIDSLNQQAWDVRVNDSPKSFELSKESVELARNIQYDKGLAHGLLSLGFCYVRLSKNNEGLILLEESLSLFQSLNDLKGQSVVYEYLAIIKRNWGDFGSSLKLLFKALELSKQTGFMENESTNHYQIGVTYKHLGNFEKALDSLYRSMSMHKEMKNRFFESYPINVIGSIYFENGDYPKALEYYQDALIRRQEIGDKWGMAGSLDSIGFTYLKLQDFHQAIDYCTRSLAISESTDDKRSQANALLHLAEINKQKGDIEQATKFCNESLHIRRASGDKRGETEILLFLAELHKSDAEKKQDKEVFEWLSSALIIAADIKALDQLSKIRYQLYEYYKGAGNPNEALKQLEIHIDLEKELHKNSITQKVQNLEISHKAEEARKEADAIGLRNKELTQLNEEIEAQKQKLEEALTELKSAQAQLIQSEKMASLGELTAGIAHEIQNPLNFVNNFSEVSNELLDEMKQEIDKGEMDEVKAIADDVKQNLEKILHHGKRADGIVKGMLQHSRSSSGQKELTDINALAEEYLRLAYHGLRAKDKSFNATMKTDFDESIGKINVIPQDIGRVILNLITNAFYAVSERKKLNTEEYEPVVTVSTRKFDDRITVHVKDNGTGIPQKVMEKIFQPFFTTKPTGQGTGLGLSLSYDIVKTHGGELKVETMEGEGSEFIIQLPL